jgi:hypothetical protein
VFSSLFYGFEDGVRNKNEHKMLSLQMSAMLVCCGSLCKPWRTAFDELTCINVLFSVTSKMISFLILLCQAPHYTHTVLQTTGSVLQVHLFELKYYFFHFRIRFSMLLDLRNILVLFKYLSLQCQNSLGDEPHKIKTEITGDKILKLGFMFSF